MLEGVARKVTFGVAGSLDNFIADAKEGVDGLLWNDEAAAPVSEFWKTIDTVLMGRKTYAIAAKAGSGAYPGVRNLRPGAKRARPPLDPDRACLRAT